MGHEVECCRKLVGSSKIEIILDVGSYHGEYCEKLIKYYKNSKYFLFEPSSKNYKNLIKKFSSRKNVNIFNIALSDQNGSSKLYSNKSGSDEASLLKKYLNKNRVNFKRSENIKIHRLETIFKREVKNKTIDICKIDVEGVEMKVIKGFGKLLKKTKLIQFEFSGANITSRIFFRDYWNFFKKNNFKLYIITPIGPEIIKEYDMSYETFRVTNYIAINKRYKFSA